MRLIISCALTFSLCYGFGQTHLYVEHFDATSSTSYIDQLPYLDYQFADPVNADVLDIPGARSSFSQGKGDYFIAAFGPRFIRDRFDFHAGADITPRVKHDGTTYNDGNTPNLICMCDGIVVEINDSWPDPNAIGKGRWVRVKCNQQFSNSNSIWGNIYLAYRHMSSVGVAVDAPVTKGQVLGRLGNTGAPTNYHLHLSVQYCGDDDGNCEDGDAEFENVHTMRVFDPARAPHLHSPFKKGDVYVELLETSGTEAIFRTAFLHNQIPIHSIKIFYNDTEHASYVFEDIYEAANDADDLDNPCYADNICVYANPINRYKSAYDRYIEATIPVSFPSQSDHPIINDFPYNTPAHVLDVVVENLPDPINLTQLRIEIRDIYGNGARATASNKKIVSNTSGDWNSGSTWVGSNPPGSSDHIVINHDVTITSGSNSIKSVVLSSNASNNASLSISNGASLAVDDYVSMIGDNDNQNTFISIADNSSSLTTGEDLTIKRYHDADQVYLQIDGNSTLNIGGNLNFIADDYSKNQGSNSSSPSISVGNISGNPNVQVTGNWNINYGIRTRKDIIVEIGQPDGSNVPVVTVDGDLILVGNISQSTNADLGIELNGASQMTVANILVDYNPSESESRHEASITLNDASQLSTGNLQLNSKLNTSSSNNLIQLNENSNFTIDQDISLFTSGAANENEFDVNGNAIIEIKEDVVNPQNSSYAFESNTQAIFSGSQQQTVPGTGAASYGTLYINNTSGEHTTIGSNVRVETNLKIDNGILDTGTGSIHLLNNATLEINHPNSYIDGTLIKFFSASPPAEFELVIGDEGVVAPVKLLDPTPLANSFISTKYIRKDGWRDDYTAPLLDRGRGYWSLSFPGSIDLAFGWRDACVERIQDLTSGIGQTLYMSKQNAGSWEQIVATTFGVSSEACDNMDGDSEAGYLEITGAENGLFSFGTTDETANPLPVTLLYFNTFQENEHIRLNWATANEINSDEFQIQRSLDGINFKMIQSIKAAGNSNQKVTYEGIDPFPVSGVSYYQLLQTDINGEFEIFGPQMIDYDPIESIKIFPTVLDIGDVLTISGSLEEKIEIEIYTLTGRLIKKLHVGNNNQVQTSTQKISSKILPAGFSLIKIRSGRLQKTARVFVK